MSTSFTPRKLPVLLGLVPLLLSAPSFASHHDHHDEKTVMPSFVTLRNRELELNSMKIKMKSIVPFKRLHSPILRYVRSSGE